MSTLTQSLGEMKKPWQWMAVGCGILVLWGVVAFPTHRESFRPAPQAARDVPVAQFYTGTAFKTKPAASALESDATRSLTASTAAAVDAAAGRKIIRTSSVEMIVLHPADAADKIAALAESMGGYLVSSDGGGQNATAGTLTIRVPAARFEGARAEIRKLGLRVESEKIEAQDVSRQFVDQDASIRNLQAEEAGYLAILKQAHTVKDMLAVTERLSEVRGQIEQQQAEFNALSRQIETVALTISLKTEVQAPVSWLNCRPGYQLKLALHDGLESVADYATVMVGILFYLPATLLWVGTIMVAIVIGWRTLRWAGRRWFGAKMTATAPQV